MCIRDRVGIVNRDDEHFEKIIEGHTCDLETYGFSPEADLRAEDAHMIGGKGYLGISYHVRGLMDFPVEIDIPGKFSIYKSLTAIAICRHFKVSQENIIRACLLYTSIQTHRQNKCFLFLFTTFF